MLRPLCLLAGLCASLVAAGSAAAAEGRLTYENAGSRAVTATSMTGDWVAPPPAQLEPGASGSARLRFPDRGVIVNHVAYREPDSLRRCSFRVQSEPGPVLCRVVVVPQPGGGISCHYRFAALDSKTCSFDLVFTLSGF